MKITTVVVVLAACIMTVTGCRTIPDNPNVRVQFDPKEVPCPGACFAARALEIKGISAWYFSADAELGATFPVNDGNGDALFRIQVLEGDDTALMLRAYSEEGEKVQRIKRDESFVFEHNRTAFKIMYLNHETKAGNRTIYNRAPVSVTWDARN